MTDDLFTTRMKRATRKAHAASDALVNAKLLFAINNDSVWGEGLLIFYEIFKFLESAIQVKIKENIGRLYVREIMNRTEAFEKDLHFYLGPSWREKYQIRDSVKNYLKHLQHLLETDSDLLMPYIYHLYMGLLSGGQILIKKRQLQLKIMKLENHAGEAVTNFGNEKISDLKTILKDKMNSIADDLDESKKEMLVKESIKVFELNNSIIRTVEGVHTVGTRNISIFFICFVLVLLFIYYTGKYFLAEKTYKVKSNF